MSCAKYIILAFTAFKKTADAILLSNGIQLCFSACQNFMDISLVSNIPYQLICGSIEYIVKRYCKLRHTKRCAEMSPDFRNRVNKIFPDFLSEAFKLH